MVNTIAHVTTKFLINIKILTNIVPLPSWIWCYLIRLWKRLEVVDTNQLKARENSFCWRFISRLFRCKSSRQSFAMEVFTGRRWTTVKRVWKVTVCVLHIFLVCHKHNSLPLGPLQPWWSSLDKRESLACQITSTFNEKIGSIERQSFLFYYKNNPAFCWMGKLSGSLHLLQLKTSMVVSISKRQKIKFAASDDFVVDGGTAEVANF